MFDSIPDEMKRYKSFIDWQLEDNGGSKPDKIPRCPQTGYRASPTNPDHWSTFEEACAKAPAYSGIGFVVSEADPYTCLDLDDPYEKLPDGSYKFSDPEKVAETQKKIFEAFNSYSERSPGGNGLHIWIKGKVPAGRRREGVEIYSCAHYMTMTGQVFHAAPIEDRQELLSQLWAEMGETSPAPIFDNDEPERDTDETIIERAGRAVNGEKFQKLWSGEWQGPYKSQSEADYALIDMLGFYSQNKAQIARLFRLSGLGKRKKAQRDNYVYPMIQKSFDRRFPPVDIEGLNKQMNEVLAQKMQNTSITCCESEASALDCVFTPPPGLVGDIARFIYDSAPIQVPEVALVGALGLMAGICGRSYNINHTGLNLYIIVLAGTGMGKDAASNGIDRLMDEVKKTVPCCKEFIGPNLVSEQGIVRHFDKVSLSFVSIVGEFGLKLKEMTKPNAPPHLEGLRRIMLSMYSKSAHGLTYQPHAHSDANKNTKELLSPSYSILGESVPSRFYEALDDSMLSEGFLPRFLVIEHRGLLPYLNEAHSTVAPSQQLINQLAALCSHSLVTNHSQKVVNVSIEDSCVKKLRDFSHFCTDKVNAARDIGKGEAVSELWNRAHLKLSRLCGLIAVGCNPYSPVVFPQVFDWCHKIILADVNNMVSKFESGLVGEGNLETRQLNKMNLILKDYVTRQWSEVAKYKVGNQKLHKDRVIPYKYLSQRLASDVNFRKDRIGATNSIKRAIETLKNNGDIKELSVDQTMKRYEFNGKCFMLTRLE